MDGVTEKLVAEKSHQVLNVVMSRKSITKLGV